MPPLFQENKQLDESELVDSLANKAPRRHTAMLISQGFNTETGDLETFMEHCKQEESTDNISGAKFSASDEDNDTKNKKKCPKFKEQDEHAKKRHKKHSSLYFLLWSLLVYLGLSLVFALSTLQFLVVWILFSPWREQYSKECF